VPQKYLSMLTNKTTHCIETAAMCSLKRSDTLEEVSLFKLHCVQNASRLYGQ
jgi:hypothetical protein